ncbi:uncharacterized protein V3H82_013731 isoform 1-T1 [Fundulus diaphanus]
MRTSGLTVTGVSQVLLILAVSSRCLSYRMVKLQVSVTCALLMMVDPTSAQLPRAICPTCTDGYYVTRNCSMGPGTQTGLKCSPCTDCSASSQETLVPCSTYTNTVCLTRNTTTTTALMTTTTTGPPATMWIGLSAACVSLCVVLLLVAIFAWMFYRNKATFMKLLPLKPSSPEKKAPPPHQSHLLKDAPV